MARRGNQDGLVKPATPTTPTANPSGGTAFIAPSGNFYDLGDVDHRQWSWDHFGSDDLPIQWIRINSLADLCVEFAADPTEVQWATLTKVILSADGDREFFIENNAGSWKMDRTAYVSEFRKSRMPLLEFAQTIKYEDLSKEATSDLPMELQSWLNRMWARVIHGA